VKPTSYLDAIMGKNSFVPIHGLFSKAHAPAKELTESYAAFHHLHRFIPRDKPCRIIHVGDGAHARTGGMFSFLTRAENISVDPKINSVVGAWRNRWNVQRFSWFAKPIEDVIDHLNELPRVLTIVTFVHAHVGTDDVLDRLNWDYAYTMACCSPDRQLSKRQRVVSNGDDLSCLSPQRTFQVLINAEAT